MSPKGYESCSAPVKVTEIRSSKADGQEANITKTPSDAAARNALVHNDPTNIKRPVRERLQAHVNHAGRMAISGNVVLWRPSFLPFHLEYTVSFTATDAQCAHLVSARTMVSKDPAQFAAQVYENAQTMVSNTMVASANFSIAAHNIAGQNVTQKLYLKLHERKEKGSEEQALLLKESGATLRELDIAQVEKLASLANAAKLDVDSLEALLTTDNTDLKPPAAKASAKTIMKLRKSREKKERQKALSEARLSASSAATQPGFAETESSARLIVEQPTFEQEGLNGDQDEDDGTVIPVQANIDQASTLTRDAREEISSELCAPIIAQTEVQYSPMNGTSENTLAQITTSLIPSPSMGSVSEELPAGTPAIGNLIDPVAKVTYVSREIPTTSIRGTIGDVRAETHSPLVLTTSSIGIGLTSYGDVSERHPAEISTLVALVVAPAEDQSSPSGSPSEDLSSVIPTPIASSTVAQYTPTDVDQTGSLSDVVDIPDDSRAHSPILRSYNTYSIEIADKNEEFPTKIDYGIDGLGYPTPASQESAVTGGSQNLAWAYATHTAYDDELRRAGIWLFEKPQDHFKAQPEVNARQGLGLVKAPIIVLPAYGSAQNAKKNHDGGHLHITAHGRVRDDIRSIISHPDFMTPTKLSEYQACEAAGEKIWRHDRDLLSCRTRGCRIQIADSNSESIICLSCGPKTIIRYCSVQHLLSDMHEHWRECGHKDLVIKQVIDHNTSPPRFARLCPSLKDVNGFKSYAAHRQKTYAHLTYGHYTLFDFADETPTTLLWPDNDPHKQHMESRIERTLNLALFDHTNESVLAYLYKLLRKCLQKKEGWVIGTQHALKLQFQHEFHFDPTTFPSITYEPESLCECEWFGNNEMTKTQHLTDCKKWTHGKGKRDDPGMKEHVEWMEAEYWILRVWRQQHKTAMHWRERAIGRGFSDVDLEDDWEPYMGPGWEGYGAEMRIGG